MRKSTIFIIIFGILTILAIFFIITTKEADAPSPEQKNQINSSSNQQNTKSGGSYVEYSEATLANSEGERVLFFHAPWCPQCRAIEKDILAKGVYDGYTILKLDYDSNQDLRKMYGITLQTTFVKVDEKGNFQEKYVAYNEPTLAALQRDFLK
jgi:thiol-disulfide isomerase/thioredoxin